MNAPVAESMPRIDQGSSSSLLSGITPEADPSSSLSSLPINQSGNVDCVVGVVVEVEEGVVATVIGVVVRGLVVEAPGDVAGGDVVTLAGVVVGVVLGGAVVVVDGGVELSS